MFTRSTLPTLAAIVLLACGSRTRAEAFDAHAAVPGPMVTALAPQSPSYSLRDGATSLRIIGRDAIAPGLHYSSMLRPERAAPWLDHTDTVATRRTGRLSFSRTADDVPAASPSGSITLGRLNLREPRSGPALGGVPQAELDRELVQLRESVSRVRLVPQVSLGMHVKF